VGLASNGKVLRHVRALYDHGTFAGLSDGALLERFAGRTGEAAELAFAALVERHGPMVLRVCRRVLADPHDAEDAFQAVFLVLARRAGAVRKRESLASWLHGVALRVAGTARAGKARRAGHERRAAARAETAVLSEGPADDIGAVLHEEIARMPDRYRAPVVLCYLEGRTYDEASRVLGCPVGTVKSRLATARATLRARLTRRGLAPAAGAITGLLAADGATAAIPGRVAESLARLAIRGAPARLALAGTAPTMVTLTEGAMRMMLCARLRFVLTLIVVGLGGAGVAVLAQQSPSGPIPPSHSGAVDAPAEAGPAGEHRSGSGVPDSTPRADPPKRRRLAIEKENALEIEKKLNELVSIDFDGVAIKDAFDSLSGQCGLRIVLDLKALKERGLTVETPVGLSASKIRLRTAIKLLIKPWDLTYCVDDGVIVITTPTADAMATVTYYVGDLLPRHLVQGALDPKSPWLPVEMNRITELLTSSVAPGTWRVYEPGRGGASGVVKNGHEPIGSVTPFLMSASLIIRHTNEVHNEVAGWLGRLRDVKFDRDAGGTPKPPADEAPAHGREALAAKASVPKKVYVNGGDAGALDREQYQYLSETIMKAFEKFTPARVVGKREDADYILEWSLVPRSDGKH
jgi:RNA polymerase sigma factor (sigma-70 family)